jgi:TonB family protein
MYAQNATCWNNEDEDFFGVCKEFYEDGSLRSKLILIKGQPNWRYAVFYKNGDTLAKAKVESGLISGSATQYNEKGEITLYIELDSNRNGTLEAYQNGEIVQKGNFVSGFKSGDWLQVDDSMNVNHHVYRRNDFSETDKDPEIGFAYGSIELVFFSSIETSDVDLQKEVSLEPATEAKFPGGEGSVNHFISTNVVYPLDAIDLDAQGKVFVSFVVEKNGRVSDVKIIKGAYSSLNREAKRVVRSMPYWIPGTLDGEPIRTRCTVPIIFTLTSGKEMRKQRRAERKALKGK